MKNSIYALILVGAVACSSPKYTTSFYYYDKSPHPIPVVDENIPAEKLSTEPSEVLVASTSQAPVEVKNLPRAEVRKTYLQMTTSERKALRHQLKADIKSYVKEQQKHFSPESVQATSAMDNDLKMAAIFGAVGVVAMFIGGDVFWIIGGIALIIGVVFFIKWLVRQ